MSNLTDFYNPGMYNILLKDLIMMIVNNNP